MTDWNEKRDLKGNANQKGRQAHNIFEKFCCRLRNLVEKTKKHIVQYIIKIEDCLTLGTDKL